MAVEFDQIRANLLASASMQSASNSSEKILPETSKSFNSSVSSCIQPVSPQLPPTPPGSRSPPNSRISPPPPQQNVPEPQRALNFSIANILRPDFGHLKQEPSGSRLQSSKSPDSPELVLRTPPKTPDALPSRESPVDLSHSKNITSSSTVNEPNKSLLPHSVNILLGSSNPTLNPFHQHIQLLQQHAVSQLQQHGASSLQQPALSQLPHPIITKPIPLSTTTAFQLIKPLTNLADAHHKRLQQQQQQQLQQQIQIQQQLQQQRLNQQTAKQNSELELKIQAKPILTSSLPSPTPSSCSTTSSCSSSSASFSPSKNSSNSSPKNNSNTKKNGEGLDELVNPKIPEDNTNWPAWVYCTRYSDRPSSGPRSRRVKRRERNPEEKRPRTAFTSDQLQRLKKEFEDNHYLNEKRRQDLARELGLQESQIKIWFQNKRAKIKKSTGNRSSLAEHLRAQGLYNHCTVPVDEDDPFIN